MFKKVSDYFWRKIWLKRIVPRKYKTTAKGQCNMQYILDKYINETKPNDYIEAYEVSIQKKVAEWRKNNRLETWFYQLDNIEKYNDGELRQIAGLNYFTILLAVENKPEREKYYNQIIDKETRSMIMTIVEGI